MALASTGDGGATWTSRSVAASSWGNPALAVSAAGVLSYVWDPAGVVLSRSSNAGASWTAPVTVDAGGENPSIAVDATSKVLFAYDRKPGQAIYFTREK